MVRYDGRVREEMEGEGLEMDLARRRRESRG